MTEYILKPVNVDELTEILKKVRSKLDEEIESARNIDSLRESYKTSLPVFSEQFLNKLIIKKGFYDENSQTGLQVPTPSPSLVSIPTYSSYLKVSSYL